MSNSSTLTASIESLFVGFPEAKNRFDKLDTEGRACFMELEEPDKLDRISRWEHPKTDARPAATPALVTYADTGYYFDN